MDLDQLNSSNFAMVFDFKLKPVFVTTKMMLASKVVKNDSKIMISLL
jgi:hypothetical protein